MDSSNSMNQTDSTNTPNQTNVFQPPYYPYPIPYEEDEIDLSELWNILWKGKWFIIGFTLICAIASIFYSLSLSNIYKAEVLMAPVNEEGGQGGISALAAQYGDLAAMAGINLGGSSSSVETNIAILKSREFIYRFIKENELMPILYEKSWDKENKKWLSTDPKVIPTQWKAYKSFTNGVLKVNQDKKTGLVILNISWKEPHLAAKWANDLVKRINAHLREKAIAEGQRSVKYLEAEIAKTSDVSMQEVLYRLIEKQAQTITLAQVRKQYAFSIIDPAVVPEKRDKPNRRMIVVIGTVMGFFISIFLQFFWKFIQEIKKKPHEQELL